MTTDLPLRWFIGGKNTTPILQVNWNNEWMNVPIVADDPDNLRVKLLTKLEVPPKEQS